MIVDEKRTSPSRLQIIIENILGLSNNLNFFSLKDFSCVDMIISREIEQI